MLIITPFWFAQEYNKWYVKVEKYKQKEKTGPNKVKLNTVRDTAHIPINRRHGN